ncbi:hypothetical protein [Cryobacterium tepidiphilum]|uniref:Uncharacterized protein n=1 Tax=Cryobacterium tepidiphilum TaxID=2486026 RepID=A0A3M8LH32_9MICO|nr:hypothetical protein [Cryobacterium tepidiphilum]RNE64042.1 hypothetical protein EEJ31_05620 [Cryobacterium tepidiphilum]
MSWQWRSITTVWVVAVVFAVLIGIFSSAEHRFAWISLALGGSVIVTLVVQLGTRQVVGYVGRVTASIVGSVVILAVATGILSLVDLA